MKKYKFALFDWDGCLSNTLANAERIHTKLALAKGIKLSKDDLKSIYGDWEKATIKSGYFSVEEFKKDYSAMVKSSILDVDLNQNARELLASLHDNDIPIGIVTTSSNTYISMQAKKDKIDKFIDYCVGFEDVKNTKPDPEPINKMLDLMKAEKSLAIMIGDTEKDVIAAANAGIDSIWYAPEYNLEFYGKAQLQDCSPTYTVKDLLQIKEFFQ